MLKLARKQFVEVVLLGTLALIVSYVMFSNKSFPDLLDMNKGKVNGAALRKESCGYVYEKIPESLLPLFNRQIQSNKEAYSSLKLSTNAASEFEFSGYTYTLFIEETLTDQSSTEKTDPGKCKGLDNGQEDVVFVSNDVNNIIKRYISSVYENEIKVISTVNFIKANGEKKEAITEITLSLAIENEGVGSEPETFNIINEKDVDWARNYADSMLTVNTLNKLRSVKTVTTDSPNTPRHLTDNEITGILSSARKVAIKNATNID